MMTLSKNIKNTIKQIRKDFSTWSSNNRFFSDAVKHPSHYQKVSEIGKPFLLHLGVPESAIDCANDCFALISYLEATKEWDFAKLNAVKYLYRAGNKGVNKTKQDLSKATTYLRMSSLKSPVLLNVADMIDYEIKTRYSNRFKYIFTGRMRKAPSFKQGNVKR